jgi:hypothetical protein
MTRQQPARTAETMTDETDTCAVCGTQIEANSVEVTAYYTAEQRREDHYVHRRCANATLGGWFVP